MARDTFSSLLKFSQDSFPVDVSLGLPREPLDPLTHAVVRVFPCIADSLWFLSDKFAFYEVD